MLDGALGTDARTRRARLGGRAALGLRTCLWAATRLKDGRGAAPPQARPWGVGRGEPGLVCEHPSSAPRVLTVPNELTNECFWGGSAPPNGSRLSCGRPARRRKSSGRQSVPPRGKKPRLEESGERQAGTTRW